MPQSQMKRLFLVDGMSQIYRAYYALPSLSNSRGLPTNAIYGFTMMLRKLITSEKPDYLVEGLIEKGDQVLLYGQPKVGKTFFAIQMACARACQKTFLNFWYNFKEVSTFHVQ